MHSWVWFLSSQRGLNSKGSSFLARWRKLKTKLEKLSPLRGIGFAGLPKVTGAKSKSGRDCRKEMEGGRLEMFDPAPGLASGGFWLRLRSGGGREQPTFSSSRSPPHSTCSSCTGQHPAAVPLPRLGHPAWGTGIQPSAPLQEACVRGKQKESSLPTAQECFCWAETSP